MTSLSGAWSLQVGLSWARGWRCPTQDRISQVTITMVTGGCVLRVWTGNQVCYPSPPCPHLCSPTSLLTDLSFLATSSAAVTQTCDCHCFTWFHVYTLPRPRSSAEIITCPWARRQEVPPREHGSTGFIHRGRREERLDRTEGFPLSVVPE